MKALGDLSGFNRFNQEEGRNMMRKKYKSDDIEKAKKLVDTQLSKYNDDLSKVLQDQGVQKYM